MPHRAFRILVAALLVGCSYASHIEYDATHSCFPACETDFPTACGWKSDGCSEQCSQECGFTGDTGEPRQAPTGLTTHTYQLVPGEEETTTETYNCTRCSVTCGTSTGCPAGFVFYALGQSQTPKACRLLQDRDYAITKSKVAGCAGCCLSSATSASVSAAPAPSAQCSDFRDYSATPLTAGDYLNGRPFADAAAWIAHHASCNQSAAGSICPAFCITNGGCRTPCKSPGSDTTPTCPNDGMGGAAGSKCRAGMSCAWEYLFPTGVQVPAPSTIDGQFEKVPRTTIIMPMCLQIGPGCYKEAAGNEPCTPCGVGKYTDQVSCPASEAIKKACNPHTPGYTDASACKDCPAGTFSPVAINRVPGKCRLCPLGKYQAKTGQSQCTSCPAGKNTTSEGAVAESACADTNSPSAPNNTTHFVTLTVTLPYTKVRGVVLSYTVTKINPALITHI